MKWNKKGRIYCPDGTRSWAKHSALTPTPVLLNDDIIRIYAGFRDDNGVSRIGYVDVKADNPSIICRVSEQPALDIGRPGMFDDNGVILGDVVSLLGKWHMFYVGFQLVEKVKFLAFSGLAISHDNGESFIRYRENPILDRHEKALYINAIHSVVFENNKIRCWLGAGSDFIFIDKNPYPKYNIKYIELSTDFTIQSDMDDLVLCSGNEYRIGRPRVYWNKHKNIFQMFYTKGTLSKAYLPGYAESHDGKLWIRKDHDIGISLSEEGWDSTSICYPSLIQIKDNVYLFYNGNDYGKTGFGYAILE